MELTNEPQSNRAKIILTSVPFILLVAACVPALFLWIETWIPTIIAGGLVIIGWAITFGMKLASVKFRFTPDAVTLFYYPITPMTSNFRRIEIAAGKLHRFEVTRSLGGIDKKLRLYENMDGQEASYPPVSLTLCPEKMIREIEESLAAYCPSGSSS